MIAWDGNALLEDGFNILLEDGGQFLFEDIVGIFAVSISEALNVADAIPAQAVAFGALSEAVALADVVSAQAVTLADFAESVTLTTADGANSTRPAQISELLAIVDVLTRERTGPNGWTDKDTPTSGWSVESGDAGTWTPQ